MKIKTKLKLIHYTRQSKDVILGALTLIAGTFVSGILLGFLWYVFLMGWKLIF